MRTNKVARIGRNINRSLARLAPARMSKALPRTMRFALEALIPRRASTDRPPRPGLSPSLFAHVAMDETIMAAAMGPNRFPRSSDYPRVALELEDAHDHFRRKGWIDDPRSYHRSPPVLRDPLLIPGMTILGQHFEKLMFESGFEPHAGEPGGERWHSYVPNHIAHAWVLRHDDDVARPWVVCVHGFGMGIPVADFVGFRAGHLHKDLGYNVVMPVLPLHGPRKVTPLGGEAFISFDLLNGVIGMAHAVWDMRRLLSWIATQNPASVGMYGVSLGGYTTALTAGFVGDLDFVLTGIPVADLLALYRAHAPRHVMRRAEEHGIFSDETDSVLAVARPTTFPALVDHDRLFMYAGIGDRMAMPEQAHTLWKHWEEPRIEWYPGNHVGYMWSGDVRRFVDEVLTTHSAGGGDTRGLYVA
ncbi:MAG: alpha/beta hydrolase [Acidimicrobiia bacterium]|nr:alpha/beta hydrolase [Acidimicrobiia bacterium]